MHISLLHTSVFMACLGIYKGFESETIFYMLFFCKSWTIKKAIQFSSVTQSCPTLCDPMNHSTPSLPVHHQLRVYPNPYSSSR